jgi:hypothetical protein
MRGVGDPPGFEESLESVKRSGAAAPARYEDVVDSPAPASRIRDRRVRGPPKRALSARPDRGLSTRS